MSTPKVSRKLNVGCGENKLEGWENNDLDLDLRQVLPYDNNTFAFILAEHVCEHLSAPDCLRFFDEAHRVLEPGGILRVCVPQIDVPEMGTEWCRNLILGHGHLMAFNSLLLIDMLALAGFYAIARTDREPMDGHWRVIGVEKDRKETLRYEARKDLEI